MTCLKSGPQPLLWSAVAAIIAIIAIASGACARLSDAQKSPPRNTTTVPSTTPPVQLPITWTDIANSYDRIRDYQCLYEKEERAISNGERQTIKVSFRKPFDVRLDWLGDKGKVDQTAIYRQGANDGKVLARQSGLLGLLTGTMKLNPNDKLALTDSSHPITEMGIGKIIERAQHDSADARISVKSSEDSLDGRHTYRFDFVATTNNKGVGGLPDAGKAVIWVDRELKFPIKLELYDRASTLLERHNFKNLRVNVNLPDATFAF